jgi:hypothetical protein
VLERLSLERPVFHSEADFQHALAWRIQVEHPDAQIRLETRPERNLRLDLLIKFSNEKVAIELKYLAARFIGSVSGERFDLPNQAAQDVSRYDFIKDIARIERFVREGYADNGWAVALSNDRSYWTLGLKADPIDLAFRLHDGRELAGSLAWGMKAGPGTTRKREAALEVSGRHTINWRDYSKIQLDEKTVGFRYLAVPIQK